MPQSEIAGKVTEVIKRLDKLVRDFRADKARLLRALEALKSRGGEESDKEKSE